MSVIHVLKVDSVSPDSTGNVILNHGTLTVRTVTGTTDTVQDTDELVKYTNASDITITIPAGFTVPHMSVHVPISTGKIKFVTAGGVSLNNAYGDNGSNVQYSPVVLFSLGTNEFYLGGDTGTV